MCKQFAKKSPCGNCPYRKDAPLKHWSVDEFRDLLAKENSQLGAVYGCHTQDGTTCTGWLMHQDKNNFPSIALRISLSKNNITREFLDQLKSDAPMYDTVHEMCRANYPAIFRKIPNQ